ncbi:hypothetical protein B0H14DRAFT_3894669 [Mycena olivaceomarginata]|nr:hypothetical protein B0H14DRAFT_3894669 [Mycena olivaceomarginata]
MSMTAYAPLRHPVLKVPYLAFELLTALVRVPCWALLAISRGWRPRKSWSWSLSVMVKLGRHISWKLPNTTTKPPRAGSGARLSCVWVSPVPQSYILGKVAMWASVAEVAPIQLPGYWIHGPGSTVAPEAPLMPGEKVIYALHGGGYTRWSAHPAQFPGHAHRIPPLVHHAARIGPALLLLLHARCCTPCSSPVTAPAPAPAPAALASCSACLPTPAHLVALGCPHRPAPAPHRHPCGAPLLAAPCTPLPLHLHLHLHLPPPPPPPPPTAVWSCSPRSFVPTASSLHPPAPMEGISDGGVDANEVKVDGVVGDALDSSLAD